jgi:hypothetical protein
VFEGLKTLFSASLPCLLFPLRQALCGRKAFGSFYCLVAFTGCSSLAGEEQKKYRAEAQGRREKKEPSNVDDLAFLSVSAPLREKSIW